MSGPVREWSNKMFNEVHLRLSVAIAVVGDSNTARKKIVKL
jgi:hypothetical protein